jgi:hypothetical protein
MASSWNINLHHLLKYHVKRSNQWTECIGCLRAVRWETQGHIYLELLAHLYPHSTYPIPSVTIWIQFFVQTQKGSHIWTAYPIYDLFSPLSLFWRDLRIKTNVEYVSKILKPLLKLVLHSHKTFMKIDVCFTMSTAFSWFHKGFIRLQWGFIAAHVLLQFLSNLILSFLELFLNLY